MNDVHPLKELVKQQAAEIARVQELEADTQRYRWLKANCGFGIRKNGVHELSIAFYDIQPDCIHQLDAAIDAAMKINHEEINKYPPTTNSTDL